MLFYILLFLGLSTLPAAADTLDHWSVSLNESLLAWGNTRDAVNDLRLVRGTLEPFDVLSIRYFRDTPCNTCETEVTVRNDRSTVLLREYGRGTGKPVNIQAYELLRYNPSPLAERLLYVYYRELDGREPGMLFRIRLE